MSAFHCTARVYWEDTDAGGVVYYANYLRFLERARTEWLRMRGHQQNEIARTLGVLFAVAEVNIKYRGPARLDDLLVITCQPQNEGAASVIFDQQIRRERTDGELLAEAKVKVVCVGADDFRPRRLPPEILGGAQ